VRTTCFRYRLGTEPREPTGTRRILRIPRTEKDPCFLLSNLFLILLSDPDDGGSMFLRNVSKLLLVHNVTSPKIELFNRPIGEHVFDMKYPSKLAQFLFLTLVT
jgi:hypothetical protein